MSDTVGDEDPRLEFLAKCTERGRLDRARKLASKVEFLIADGELAIAAVANYNVVVDVVAHRIQHGCRDFQGQAGSRRLCKHVAAKLLALDKNTGLLISRELAESAEAPSVGVVPLWSLEVITRFSPRGTPARQPRSVQKFGLAPAYTAQRRISKPHRPNLTPSPATRQNFDQPWARSACTKASRMARFTSH